MMYVIFEFLSSIFFMLSGGLLFSKNVLKSNNKVSRLSSILFTTGVMILTLISSIDSFYMLKSDLSKYIVPPIIITNHSSDVPTVNPIPQNADEISKLHSAEVSIFNELSQKDFTTLYTLKASLNACSQPQLVDCHHLSNNTVKSFIEAAIAFKQNQDAHTSSLNSESATDRSFYVSIISMFISLSSMSISFLSYRKKPPVERLPGPRE